MSELGSLWAIIFGVSCLAGAVGAVVGVLVYRRVNRPAAPVGPAQVSTPAPQPVMQASPRVYQPAAYPVYSYSYKTLPDQTVIMPKVDDSTVVFPAVPR